MKVKTISHEMFGTIRVLKDDAGNYWFVGKDIVSLLGYKNNNDAINQHCKGSSNYHQIQTQRGIQNMRIISEGDMYRLVGSSHLSSAQCRAQWLYDIVIPTMKKLPTWYEYDFLIDKEQ